MSALGRRSVVWVDNTTLKIRKPASHFDTTPSPVPITIVIYLNGTSPSECRHFLCWHTKGHIWIEGCLKHYRWVCYELHLSSIQLVIFTFEYVKFHTCLFLYATHVHTRPFLQHVTYYTRVFVIATHVPICTWDALRAARVSYVSCQY